MDGAVAKWLREGLVDETVLLEQREPVEARARHRHLKVVTAAGPVLDPNLGRVFNLNGNGPAFPGPNSGLDTRFSGSPVSSVPDSSSGALLLGLGLVGVFSVGRVISLQQRV